MAVFVVEMPKVKAPTVIVDEPVLLSDTSNAPEPPAAAPTDWTETIVLPCAPTDKKSKTAKAVVEYFIETPLEFAFILREVRCRPSFLRPVRRQRSPIH